MSPPLPAWLRNAVLVALLFVAGCALVPRTRDDVAEPDPDTPLGQLHDHLHAMLVEGRMPELDDLSREQAAALADPQSGVAADFREWLDYCIAYNRKLEAAQAYTPLPVVRRFQEDPLNLIWRGDSWVRGLAAQADPVALALAVYRDDMGIAVPASLSAETDPDDPIAALRAALLESAAIIDREALGALDAGQRELMGFVVPWIARVNARFVNRSKGAPMVLFNKQFRPHDPFAPGAGMTPGGLVVPPALYSMTGVYHYLRAVAGEPVRTDGVGADREAASDGPLPHPDFEAAVDMAAMGRALQRLQPLLAEAALDRLEAALHRLAAAAPDEEPTWPGVTGRLLLAESTPYGALLIGGPGPNQYEDVDAAFILDLGGDNTYRFTGRPESLTRHPLRVIIDFAGDDVYIAEGIGGPGAGILGIGILIDRQGDDRYLQGITPNLEPRAHTRETLLADDPEGADTHWVPFVTLYGNPAEPEAEGVLLDAGFAFGAAFMGIGIHYDASGDDLYLGQKYCFGSAFWKGLALLVDGGGDDVFAAGHTAIGSGINAAVGILSSRGGNNHYQCLGLFENAYSVGSERDNGYDGSGIGYGSAWRAEARRPDQGWVATLGGGLGLVHDAGGDDQYIGSSFGIASGYAGGIGMLVDDAGNDTYFAKRGPGGSNENGWSGNHAVGNGCHRGVGYLLDGGGDDRYSASSIGGGNAWDISSTFLLDLGGNDRYTDLHGRNVRGSIGNGAASSFAVCFNAGGSNTWERSSLGSAHWLPDGYPGPAVNFSFLISAGPNADHLPRGYSNDTVRLNGVAFEPARRDRLRSSGLGLFAEGVRALPGETR